MSHSPNCPDCTVENGIVENNTPKLTVPRRKFLQTSAAAVAAFSAGVSALPNWAVAKEAVAAASTPESLVKLLMESLSPGQKETICFDWDYQDAKRGLLRTYVSNNWKITEPNINDDFYTKDQRQLVRDIFKGLIQPDWVKKIDKQLEDDAGGFGNEQSIAIFGAPGEKFEFVMTGRHMTLRCDGNSASHVAFGGPIFYGHAADGFNEKPDHPGNVFWPQAQAANKVYQMLDEKQRKGALVTDANLPREQAVGFRGKKNDLPGIPVTEMSADQQSEMQKVLALLLEPYRQGDRDEVLACLKAQGGLEGCSLAFYQAGDLGNDQVWDNWRLEGPSFVWHFRGTPHVHVWVNVADDASVKLNA
ncbi:MAG: DUF3500 domain-containing protein [Pirellulales bacterium]|nr:DUF3500 domain-containing protein [Pirellulales bacterium]